MSESLTPEQERAFYEHLRTAGARETCPLCDAGRATVRLVCGGEFIARICTQCGHVLLFDRADAPVMLRSDGPFRRTDAALRELTNKLTIEIAPVAIQIGTETIARIVWPAIEQRIDAELAAELGAIGIALRP